MRAYVPGCPLASAALIFASSSATEYPARYTAGYTLGDMNTAEKIRENRARRAVARRDKPGVYRLSKSHARDPHSYSYGAWTIWRGDREVYRAKSLTEIEEWLMRGARGPG